MPPILQFAPLARLGLRMAAVGAACLLLVCTFTGCQGSNAADKDSARQAEPLPMQWIYPTEAMKSAHNRLAGRPAPALNVTDWMGEKQTLEDLEGKIVLVDFWATWCTPCLKAIPKLNDLQAKYKDNGIELIGICASNGAERMEEVASEHGMKYPTAKDASGQTQAAWGVDGFPTYAILDRQGIVRGVGIHPENLEEALRKVLLDWK